MDIFVLKALVDNLQQHLSGMLVSKVFQLSPDDILIRGWRRQDVRLLLSTHTRWQRLHTTTSRFYTPPRPPRFAALLRARLQRVRLHAIDVRPYERTAMLHWHSREADTPPLTLVHELHGPRANITLVNADGIIIDALKRHPETAAGHPPRLPGHPYVPPALPPQRVRLCELTLAHLQALQQQGCFDTPHLLRLVTGLNSLVTAELLHRSQGQAEACWHLIRDLQQRYEEQTLSLSLCTMPDHSHHLTVLPITHRPCTSQAFTEAQEAAAACYQPALVTASLEQMRHTLHKTVRQRLAKLHKKIQHLTHDYEQLLSYLSYQQYGTLLLSQPTPRGTTSAQVIDYYHPQQASIHIALDPRLSAQDNAQQYFKKYRKAKNGVHIVQTLLTQCYDEEQYLSALTEQIQQADDWSTLESIATELDGTLTTSRPPQRTATRPKTPPALPYRTLTSSDGYTLYCGKSNHGNDFLLRQMASPDDLWLHAAQQAGAHVLVKVPSSQDVPLSTLTEAAALAAFYSQGKHTTAVEVMYTQVKHVRKFRGARPGQVHVQSSHTLTVTPQLPGHHDIPEAVGS